jgi:hypothetical protein
MFDSSVGKRLPSHRKKVVNTQGLQTKALIAGLIQRRWTLWSKNITWFYNYYKDKLNTISFLK